jgi:hypothetical protein
MFEFLLTMLPDDLRARLLAAGASDDASLAEIQARDPELWRELDAYVAANQDTLNRAWLHHLLLSFASVPDSDGLWALWQQVPSELEDEMVAAVEDWIGQAEQAGDTATAEGLRVRLEGLRQLQAQQRDLARQLDAWVDRLAALEDMEQLPQLWREVPRDLEEAFLAAGDARVDAAQRARNNRLANHLRSRLTRLRVIQVAERQVIERPPLEQALLAFLAAEGDTAARALFAERRELLAGPGALPALDQFVRQAAPDLRPQIEARRTLLRELQGDTNV